MFSRLTRIAVTCLLAGLCVSPALAAGKKKRDRNDPAARIKKKLAAAELPADALTKANKVVDENAPKLKEAQAKLDAVLTAEHKQARRQAQKDAKTAGKKRKEAAADAQAAMKLTDEQKSKLASAESEVKAAQAAVLRDLRGVLSQEQLAKAGFKAKKKKST
jgi:hypothetical protein